MDSIVWRFFEFFYIALVAGPAVTIAWNFFSRIRSGDYQESRLNAYAGILWCTAIVVLVIGTKNYVFQQLVYS